MAWHFLKGSPLPNSLGVDSFSILFHPRSFQKPDRFSLISGGFLRSGSLGSEWTWKVPPRNSAGFMRLGRVDLSSRPRPRWSRPRCSPAARCKRATRRGTARALLAEPHCVAQVQEQPADWERLVLVVSLRLQLCARMVEEFNVSLAASELASQRLPKLHLLKSDPILAKLPLYRLL